MKWEGYNESANTMSFAVPPTWRDIPAIIRGTYKPTVIELDRESDADYRECPPEFLLGADSLNYRGQKRARDETEVAKHVTYNIYTKPEKKEREPYRHIESDQEHPAVATLRKYQLRQNVKEDREIRVLITKPNAKFGEDNKDSHDLLAHNQSNPLQGETNA